MLSTYTVLFELEVLPIFDSGFRLDQVLAALVLVGRKGPQSLSFSTSAKRWVLPLSLAATLLGLVSS